MFEEVKKAVIYVRLSNDSERTGSFSIENQKEACQKKAEDLGYEVVAEFEDDGISAYNLKRGIFSEVYDTIKNNPRPPFNCFICYDMSRFCRRMKYVLDLTDLLDAKKIRFVSIADAIDSWENKEVYFQKKASFAMFNEMYILRLKARVPAGMRKSASHGWHQGGRYVPQGYRKIYNEQLRRFVLEIEPVEAEIVKEIFQRFAQGWGAYRIAKSLNTRGITTKNGNIWRTKSVLDIAHNPIYCGKIRWGRTKSYTVDEETGKKRQEFVTPQISQGKHSSIITEEIYEYVQEQIAKRKSEKIKPALSPRKRNGHLLSGILYCPACGSKMLGAYQPRKRGGEVVRDVVYVCSAFRSGGTCKHASTILEHRALNILFPLFRPVFQDYYTAYVFWNREEEDDTEKLSQKLQEVKEACKREEKKIDALLLKAVSEQSEVIQQRISEVIKQQEKRVNELQRDIKELQVRLEKKRLLKKQISDDQRWMKEAQNYEMYFEGLDREQQKVWFERIFQKVVIKKEGKTRPKNYFVADLQFKNPDYLHILGVNNITETQRQEIKQVFAEVFASDLFLRELAKNAGVDRSTPEFEELAVKILSGQISKKEQDEVNSLALVFNMSEKQVREVLEREVLFTDLWLPDE